MQIGLDELIVTQNGLRNCRQVKKMIEFIKAGGMFTRDARLAQSILGDSDRGIPPPMHIARMEDGLLVLHDGHHRAVSLLFGGRNYIDPEEYEMVDYTYHDYEEAHPKKGWFTPFQISTQVRLPDFGWFKENAQIMYWVGGMSSLRWFIQNHAKHYRENRRISTVKELASIYQEVCNYNGKYRNLAVA